MATDLEGQNVDGESDQPNNVTPRSRPGRHRTASVWGYREAAYSQNPHPTPVHHSRNAQLSDSPIPEPCPAKEGAAL